MMINIFNEIILFAVAVIAVTIALIFFISFVETLITKKKAKKEKDEFMRILTEEVKNIIKDYAKKEPKKIIKVDDLNNIPKPKIEDITDLDKKTIDEIIEKENQPKPKQSKKIDKKEEK